MDGSDYWNVVIPPLKQHTRISLNRWPLATGVNVVKLWHRLPIYDGVAGKYTSRRCRRPIRATHCGNYQLSTGSNNPKSLGIIIIYTCIPQRLCSTTAVWVFSEWFQAGGHVERCSRHTGRAAPAATRVAAAATSAIIAINGEASPNQEVTVGFYAIGIVNHVVVVAHSLLLEPGSST